MLPRWNEVMHYVNSEVLPFQPEVITDAEKYTIGCKYDTTEFVTNYCKRFVEAQSIQGNHLKEGHYTCRFKMGADGSRLPYHCYKDSRPAEKQDNTTSVNTFDLMLLEVESGYDVPDFYFREKDSNSDRKTRVLGLVQGKEESEENLKLYTDIQRDFLDMEEHGVEFTANEREYCFIPQNTCYRNDGKMNGILTGRRGPSCPSCINGKAEWSDYDQLKDGELIVNTK